MQLNSKNEFINYDSLIKRSVIIFILSFYLFRWYSHLLPYHYSGATMVRINYNLYMHLYRLLEFDYIITHSKIVAIVFTLLLFFVPIVLFIKINSKFWSILFIILNFVYNLIYTTHINYALHYLEGFVILSLIFLTYTNVKFNLVWQGLRLFICLTYFIAFVWKFVNGAFFQIDYGEAVFKKNLATYMFLNPDSYMTSIYYYFLQHPLLLNLGTYVCFLMEGVLIIGLFTKKYDKYLIINILLLHHLLYLFVDTLFIEWYIFILPFLTPAFWNKMEHKINKITSIRLN
jgi:hypothetical protein